MSDAVNITVEQVRETSPELMEALARLVPQLSSSWRGITSDEVEAIVTDPHCALFLARTVEATIIGTLTLVAFSIPTGHRAWIEDVVVDESARGLGAAKALVSAALDEARARSITTVDLTSRPSRVAANQLYLSMGFESRETNVYRFSLDS